MLNKFEASLSVVSPTSERERARILFFDPTPTAIRGGRKPLYDAHATSGLGLIACAACHSRPKAQRR